MCEHISTLDVKTNNSLKAKRCTLVIISYEASSNSKGKIKEDEQASSDYITIREVNDLKAEGESIEALETSEDGAGLKHGQANGMFLEHYFS